MQMNDSIVINLVMFKIGDKLLELEEHLAYERQLVAELKQLMAEWADVLGTAPIINERE